MSGSTLTNPAAEGKAVTPSDSVDIATTRFLHVSGAGILRVICHTGAELTFTAEVGYHPIRVTRVYQSTTTATGITAFY